VDRKRHTLFYYSGKIGKIKGEMKKVVARSGIR